MKYALTYTEDMTSYGGINTVIFTTPHTDEGVGRLSEEELTKMVERVLTDYGIGRASARTVATHHWYLIRNCDDVDVEVQ